MPRRLLSAVVVLLALAPLACSSSKGSKQAFCAQLRVTPSMGIALAGFGTDDPRTLRTKLDEATRAFTALERAAPRAVRSDVASVADLVDQISQAVEATPNDLNAIRNRLRGLAMSHAGAARAALSIAKYGQEQCNIALNLDYGPTTTAGPAQTTTTR